MKSKPCPGSFTEKKEMKWMLPSEVPDRAHVKMFWFLRHKTIYVWSISVFIAVHTEHISIHMNSFQLLEQINLLQAIRQRGSEINSRWNSTLFPIRELPYYNKPLHLSSPPPMTATLSVHVVAPAAPCHLCPAAVVLWSTTWVGHAAIFSLEGKACKSASWEERHCWIVICLQNAENINFFAAHQGWKHLPLPFSAAINMLHLGIDWFQAA